MLKMGVRMSSYPLPSVLVASSAKLVFTA